MCFVLNHNNEPLKERKILQIMMVYQVVLDCIITRARLSSYWGSCIYIVPHEAFQCGQPTVALTCHDSTGKVLTAQASVLGFRSWALHTFCEYCQVPGTPALVIETETHGSWGQGAHYTVSLAHTMSSTFTARSCPQSEEVSKRRKVGTFEHCCPPTNADAHIQTTPRYTPSCRWAHNALHRNVMYQSWGCSC